MRRGRRRFYTLPRMGGQACTRRVAVFFPQHKKGPPLGGPFPEMMSPGNVLLSHAVAHAVPSALRGLTTVFGMGTGVAPSL